TCPAPGPRCAATAGSAWASSRSIGPPAAALLAALAEEPLDLADQVVPGRQSCLVDQRLEPLDVLLRRLLARRGGVESDAHEPRLLGQASEVELRVEMPPERAQQVDRRLRVVARDVVRDLGEVAERRDARLRDGD